jgi:D-lactate dehydrogenase (cytochrome)
LRHRIRARAPREAASPHIYDDADTVSSFLSDAAHVGGGFAAGVAFPRTEAEVSALVARARRVLPVGAQSSLTGGATPRGDLVICTRALQTIAAPSAGGVRVGAGVPIMTLQHHLAAERLFYPPAPTFEGAFVGGTIATNAAGPCTFKYGSTRPWVAGISVVLADGDVLDIERGQATASPAGSIEIERSSGEVVSVPLPSYVMPDVEKLSAGYFGRSESADLIDLFIGSEGTLGVIVEATLRVATRRDRCVALVECRDDTEAVVVTRALRRDAAAAWARRGALDVAAVEYIDARALAVVADEAFVRAGVPRPDGGAALLVVQIEIDGEDDAALAALDRVLNECGVRTSPRLAMAGDERGARQLIELREAVPAAVNAFVGAARTAHPRIEKTAGDMIVPFERVLESIGVYRDAFERRGLRYAIWGHVSDGNLHPNVLPEKVEDMESGREALLEIAERITALGGAPLAEHGVGRSPLKQRLLRDLYGESGIEQMRAVKRALDPEWKLSPGVLFPQP